MLTLEPGLKAAMGARGVSVEPLLYVRTGAGIPTYVPASLIPSRPRRRLSPFIEKSPVMRLDFEVMPTDANRDLFQEGRVVEYFEVIEGQQIPRFYGEVKAIEKGWAIDPGGAVVETIKVNALSPSQLLTEYDDEYVSDDTGATLSVPVVAKVLYTAFEPFSVVRGGSTTGKDPCPEWVNCILDPQGEAGMPSTAAVCEWYDTDGVSFIQASEGADFRVVVDADALKIEWLGTATQPAAGQEYWVKARLVKGFLFESSPHVEFTPGANYASTLDTYHIGYSTPEQIGDDMGGPYERGWCARYNYFLPYKQVGTAGTMDQDYRADYWVLDHALGILRYAGPAMILSTNGAPRGYEVTALGILGTIVDPTNGSNDAARYVQRLYSRAGLLSGTFEDTGIALNFHQNKDKGDRVLAGYLQNLPPNYFIHDDGEGYPLGYFVTQKAQADFKLRTLTALASEEPPSLATLVRLAGVTEVTEYVGEPDDTPYGVWGGNWKYPRRLRDGLEDTYAELGSYGAKAFLVIPNQYNKRIKQVSVRFQGEMRLSSCPTFDASTQGTGGTPLPGQLRYIQAEPGTVTLTGFDTMPTREGEGRWELTLDFWAISALSVDLRVYEVTVTYERHFCGEAYLTNDASLDGLGWQTLTSTNDYGSRDFCALYYDPALIARWMVVPSVVTLGADDPFYRDRYRHRMTEVVDPGFVAIQEYRLREMATQYMEDILRQARAQKATVIMEPEAEIGDTVEVYDASTGETGLRLIVGFEDGGTWEAPTTTLELADFS